MFPNQWRPGFGPRGGMGQAGMGMGQGGMGMGPGAMGMGQGAMGMGQNGRMGMGVGPPMTRPMMGGMRQQGPMGGRPPFGRGMNGPRGGGPRPSMGARGPRDRPVEYFEKPGGPSLGVFVGEVS